MIQDVLDGNPFNGIGKSEPFKYVLENTWSRRIDQEHRLVYKIEKGTIHFLRARYHYKA